MLSLHRRHTRKCSAQYKLTDRAGKRCHCNIHVSGTLAGSTIRESLHTRDWATASRLLNEAEARGSWSAKTDKNCRSILDAYDAFLTDAASEKGRALKPATISSYQTLRRKLEAFLVPRKLTSLASVTPEHIRQFRDSLSMGSRSAANTLVKLSCAFRFAVMNDWLDRNPCDLVKRPKSFHDADSQKQPFSKEEMELIFAGAAADSELTTLIWLMRTTGLRISDAVFLKRGETIDGNLKVKTRKSGAVVTMPLEPHVYERLTALPATHGDYYFVDADTHLGTATDRFRRKMNKIFRKAEIQKATPHRFRHSFSVGLLEKGVSFQTLAKLLGHSSVAISERFYAYWSKGRDQALTDELKRTWDTDEAA
jgi:integrase/recombinase XerD